MNDIINKIIKSVEDLGVLTDGVTETVKHEAKKNKMTDILELAQHIYPLNQYNQ